MITAVAPQAPVVVGAVWEMAALHVPPDADPRVGGQVVLLAAGGLHRGCWGGLLLCPFPLVKGVWGAHSKGVASLLSWGGPAEILGQMDWSTVLYAWRCIVVARLQKCVS